METRMNNENMQKENEDTQIKPSGLHLTQKQLLGVVGIVVLIALGLVFRSNGQSDGQTESSVVTATTVQKTLLQTAEEAIALNPQDSQAWYTKGVYQQINVGDNLGAVESYSRAIEITPGFLSALFNRGLALKNLSRFEEAITDFEAIVELQSGVAPQALYNLGLIAIEQGDTVSGDAFLQKAYEQDPSLKP